MIVALPTDPAVLNHPEYKARGYTIGAKAIAVRVKTGFSRLGRQSYLILSTQNSRGTDAEYIAFPWDKIFPIPPESKIDTRTGAAGFLQATTVLTFMNEAYEVKKGDTILIHTVAGGFGLIAAQYAKSKGATVIGTTSTDAKAELAKSHGADHVILYTKENTVQKVLEITNGVGVDAVYDGVGKDTYVSLSQSHFVDGAFIPISRFEGNFQLLKRKGTLVSFGNASGPVPPFSPLKLMEKNLKLIRPVVTNYMVTPEEGTHYSKLFFDVVGKGVVKINIFHEYPFTAEGVRQAQTDLPRGKSTGKLILKIGD